MSRWWEKHPPSQHLSFSMRSRTRPCLLLQHRDSCIRTHNLEMSSRFLSASSTNPVVRYPQTLGDRSCFPSGLLHAASCCLWSPQPNAGMGGHLCHPKCLWHHPVRCSQLWRAWHLPLLSRWGNRGIETVKYLTLTTWRARRPPPASRPSFPCGCSIWWLSLTHPSLLRHPRFEPFSYHRGLKLVGPWNVFLKHTRDFVLVVLFVL